MTKCGDGARFVQSIGTVFGDVIGLKLLMRFIGEETGQFRDRVYSPMVTLGLFIEQVLSADQSCQDAVARALSARVAQRQAPSSLKTGLYCKACARLPLGLLERMGREGWAGAVCGAASGVALAYSRGKAGRWHGGVDA